MVKDYFNQTIALKTKGAVNEYNEASYSSSNIAGRFEYKRRLVRNAQGQEVVSEARLFTEASVSEDDVITHDGKDWTVIAVEDIVDLDGITLYREVSL